MDKHYDNAAVDRLYNRIWGEDIHYGVYLHEDDSIELATGRTKEVMADPVPLGSESLVLEVGCGYGSTARYLAERFGCRVVASNISETQLEHARERTRGSAAEALITFEEADYHELPYDDNSFDCWWCQEALVHSPDKPRVLAEAFRVLKPGGYAVVSDQIFRPDRLDPEETRAVMARYHTDRLSGPRDYAEMIRNAGFTLVEYRDWQEHAATHRRKILDRMKDLMPELREEIDPDTLERNYRSWSDWADLARDGKLGFDYYLARKP